MWNDSYRLLQREWKRIRCHRLYLTGLILVPLLLIGLIFSIYGSRSVTELPTVVIDNDQSSTSRNLIRLLNQHRYLDVRYQTHDYEEAMNRMKSHQVYVILVIPRNFEKELKRLQQPVVQIYSYGANLLIGKLVQKGVLETVLTLSNRISAGLTSKLRHEMAFTRSQTPLIRLYTHNLFNPGFNYQIYLPPGVIVTLFQMLIILLTVTLINREIEQKTWSDLIRLSQGRFFPVLIGKAGWLFSIMSGWGIIMAGLAFPLFSIPLRGNILIFWLSWEFFIISCILLGFGISILFRQSHMATEAGIFVTAPAFAFSGYTFPLTELPIIHYLFAMIMPSTHYLPLFIQIYLQGSPPVYLFHNLLRMMGVVLILGLLVYGSFRRLRRITMMEAG